MLCIEGGDQICRRDSCDWLGGVSVVLLVRSGVRDGVAFAHGHRLDVFDPNCNVGYTRKCGTHTLWPVFSAVVFCARNLGYWFQNLFSCAVCLFGYDRSND